MTKNINEGTLAEKLTIASGADNTEDIKNHNGRHWSDT